MEKVGLHLQIESTLVALARKAIRLNLKIFQCFLAQKTVGRLIHFEKNDIDEFITLRKKHFGDLYLHSSYWVNLCDTKRTYHPLLEKELELAQKLEFTHIVLHAGSSRGAKHKDEAIDALARSIDKLLADSHGLTVILENTAHGGNAVGSDLRDFKKLLKKLEQPEKIKFCIDIAHAYLFGYDVVSSEGQDQFVELVDNLIGWNNVVLIHLNDTTEKMGAKIDEHCALGDGKIGDMALKRFVLQPKVVGKPIIMELPHLSEQEQEALLKKVSSWLVS